MAALPRHDVVDMMHCHSTAVWRRQSVTAAAVDVSAATAAGVAALPSNTATDIVDSSVAAVAHHKLLLAAFLRLYKLYAVRCTSGSSCAVAAAAAAQPSPAALHVYDGKRTSAVDVMSGARLPLAAFLRHLLCQVAALARVQLP